MELLPLALTLTSVQRVRQIKMWREFRTKTVLVAVAVTMTMRLLPEVAVKWLPQVYRLFYDNACTRLVRHFLPPRLPSASAERC